MKALWVWQYYYHLKCCLHEFSCGNGNGVLYNVLCTCLLINDAHHKYLQATLNLDSCLEIHCMPNPFGEKIKKSHYSNVIKLVSNILNLGLLSVTTIYRLQTTLFKLFILLGSDAKKNTYGIFFEYFISYFTIRGRMEQNYTHIVKSSCIVLL